MQPIFRLFGLYLVLRLDDILNHHQQSMKDLAIFVGLNATHTHTYTNVPRISDQGNLPHLLGFELRKRPNIIGKL